ncbi:MAG TPA: DUF2200 domain-containing protein [Candidatus Companilactobacillus pullicola]|jgi:Uncharacterized protein conserved in bacteria|uniref:DUF2200 domain-containing protein n=2 Tax=Companilactobacillus TaxID=2767879 RepID=A0A9D1ZNH9_9LACO|nr:DUF2200 domain-containing protein [Candidatus Companilactobacillus pullicola]
MEVIMKKKDITQMAFRDLYPLYVKKVERKGHSQSEVNQIIYWLTGYNDQTLLEQIQSGASLASFFQNAPHINENTTLIRGSICGIRVENIQDPLIQEIRYLDKLIDELAHNKAMEHILRSEIS